MSKKPTATTINKRHLVLGCPVDEVSIEEALSAIAKLLKSNQAHFVVKPYVEFAYHASTDPALAKLLQEASLSLADGVSLRWALSYMKLPGKSVFTFLRSVVHIISEPSSTRTVISDRFAGTAFTVPLLEHASKNNWSVYLVGAPKQGTIEDRAEYIKEAFSLNVLGSMHGRPADGGSFTSSQQMQLASELRRLRPDVVLVGLGFPRQERVISQLARQLDHGVLIGEGGTFDFDEMGGSIKKAPQLMQRLELEWFWRLILEPRRLKRQMIIPVFLIKVFRSKRRG